jgi:triosephosphate isomerase
MDKCCPTVADKGGNTMAQHTNAAEKGAKRGNISQNAIRMTGIMRYGRGVAQHANAAEKGAERGKISQDAIRMT